MAHFYFASRFWLGRPLSWNWGDNLLLVPLALAGVVIAAKRVTLTQAEDQGIFMSIAGFVAHGDRLYTDIFEIKDPLFLWPASIAVHLFGPAGPFLVDAAAVIIAPVLAYSSARAARFPRIVALISAAVFSLTLTGTYYQSFRSGIIAIDLLILAFGLFAAQRFSLAGAVAAGVMWSKLPYVVMLPMALPSLVTVPRNLRIRTWISTVRGFMIMTVAVCSALALRGELHGYMLAVKENFAYRSDYLSIVGRSPGIRGHIETFALSGTSFWMVCGLLGLASFVGLMSNTGGSKRIRLGLIILMATTVIFLVLTAMWPHHLQVLSLAAWASTLLVCSVPAQLFYRRTTRRWFTTLCAIAAIVFTGLVAMTCGADWSMAPRTPLTTLLHPNDAFVVPPEVSALETAATEHPNRHRTLARLGMNDDLGFGAFLRPEWHMACPRFWQAGQESNHTNQETLDCLARQPDFVLVNPSFWSNRPVGTYNGFRESAEILLSREFTCTNVPARSGSKICIRDDATSQ
jgi:hypothetical protein